MDINRNEQEQANSQNSNDDRECTMCSRSIDAADYMSHVQKCRGSSTVSKICKPCIICSKDIAEPKYIAHVNACLNQSLHSSHSAKSTARGKTYSCFICKSPLDATATLSHVMPCRSHHMLCLSCLEKLMEEHIRSKTDPRCCTGICDYQLSKHDVSCLPLKYDILTNLLTLVTTERRSQCPRCLFYVEFQTMAKFEQHVISCDPDDTVPCEFCHCLYRFYQLDDHTAYCRNIPVHEQRQAFIDFIMSKLKYPFTPVQVRYFIELQKQKRRTLDPHALVDTMAKFEDQFPFKVPTLDCAVCMETYAYEDIFVFGCKDSHKLCYTCFEQSCTTKVNNNEVLTCGICDYQLHDGEINQLRVSRQQKRKFHEYQTEKTFNNFINHTRGIIKCPNRVCKWAAEARNPNERFRVVCNACKNEFCSICNQHYHYRTNCQEVLKITQQWFVWCNTERGNYWKNRAKQDAAYQAQLADYDRQSGADARRNEELRRRYEELMADEAFKAKNCRLCPHCKRVVQHMGGCSSMICGRNYHGGDQQSGCGKSFSWDEALLYIPIVDAASDKIKSHLLNPENMNRVVHRGIRCNGCHNEIEGILFRCIHCRSLNYCEKCEQRCTLSHSEELQKQKKQQHVFQLVMTPDVSRTRQN